jgi:hypothetical protein
MIILIESKNQTKATFITYYQGFLAIAAILLFFTKLDIYLNSNHGFFIPLFWLLGFLLASFPLWLSLLHRLDSLSKPLLIWCGVYISLSFISILVQPVFPKQQYLEDQYRTIIFLLLMIGIFTYHPLLIKWIKLTIMSVTFINMSLFVYEFFNPLAFYLKQIAPGRSSGFYGDSNTAGNSLVLGMILTIDLIKPKYRLLYSLFIFIGLAPTFSRGAIVGWFVVVALLMIKKAIPRYQISMLLVFFLVIISILSTQINHLKYLKDSDGKELFHKDTLARVEFLIDPLAQKDDSKASREEHVQIAWQKFSRHPFMGNGLGSGENTATISQVGMAQRSHNTYLDQMVEFGFLGVLLFPSLLLASVWKAEEEFNKQAVAFVIFLLAQGFFSHTLISESCSLIVYAIMANLAKHSSLKNFSNIETDEFLDKLYFHNLKA